MQYSLTGTGNPTIGSGLNPTSKSGINRIGRKIVPTLVCSQETKGPIPVIEHHCQSQGIGRILSIYERLVMCYRNEYLQAITGLNN